MLNLRERRSRAGTASWCACQHGDTAPLPQHRIYSKHR